jgi:hypothetical protein
MKDRPLSVQVVLATAGGENPNAVPVIRTASEGKNVGTANTMSDPCRYEWMPGGYKKDVGVLSIQTKRPVACWIRCTFLDKVSLDDHVLSSVWAEPYIGQSMLARRTGLPAADIRQAIARLERAGKLKFSDRNKGWWATNLR